MVQGASIVFRVFMHTRLGLSLVALAFCLAGQATQAVGDLVTFDELTTYTANTARGSYYNGDSGIGSNTLGWSSGGVGFGNNYDSRFGGFWGGFSYSNINDPSTPGFGNQYAANTATGVGGSENYALAFGGPRAYFNLPTLRQLQSVFVTNTAYATFSMQDGDQFAKKFGGVNGDDPDFFSVRFEGYSGLNGTGALTGSVDFLLADYQLDNSRDYIIRDWTQVDLTNLGMVNSVRLSFTSSDVGQFGINTPTYVALDNLAFSAVPEPSSMAILATSLGAIAWLRLRKR